MVTVTPLLHDFLFAARAEFSFLRSDFGYEEVPALPTTKNEYAVKFQKGEVAVLVEGINWGCGINVLVSIGDLTAPLWAIAKAKGRAIQPYPPGQLTQLKVEAHRLRAVAGELLCGNASELPLALAVVAKTAAETVRTKERRLP
jgi:hypothetical protein